MSGNYKHGGQGTRLYRIWKSMRQRCRDPHCNRYYIYGGKGVKVCQEWDDFACFRQWALENGYSDNLTIDRINVDGDYEPSNCRWVSNIVQQNNRSTNRRLSFMGEEHTLSEWSRLTGIRAHTIRARIEQQHWSVARALTETVNHKSALPLKQT